MNVSLISYHFHGKEGLHRAVLEDFANVGLSITERLLSVEPSSPEDFNVRIRLFAEEFFAIHLEHRETCLIIHRENDMLLPHTKEIFFNIFLRVFERLVGFIEAGQKRGFVRDHLHPRLTAGYLIGAMKHIIFSDPIRITLGEPSIEDPAQRALLINQTLDIFFRGVSA